MISDLAKDIVVVIVERYEIRPLMSLVKEGLGGNIFGMNSAYPSNSVVVGISHDNTKSKEKSQPDELPVSEVSLGELD